MSPNKTKHCVYGYIYIYINIQGEGGAEVDGVEHPAEEDEADEFHQAPREQEDVEEEQRGLGAAHQVQPGDIIQLICNFK